MPPSHDPTRRLSFGADAARYHSSRPSFPPAAVSWALGDSPQYVVELGAGTGKLTEQLLASGHHVLATDADPLMLVELRSRLPQVPAAAASAERLPCRPRSADVVVVGNAMHWFDLSRAVPEIARVLRPGGALVMMWNRRDEGVPWVKRLGRIIQRPVERVDPVQLLAEFRQFDFIESKTFRHWHDLRRQGLLDLVGTYSHVAVMGADERARVLTEVGELYDSYGRGADGMRLPYLTDVHHTVVRIQDPADLDEGRAHATETIEADGTGSESGADTRNAGSRGPSFGRGRPDDDGTLLIDFR